MKKIKVVVGIELVLLADGVTSAINRSPDFKVVATCTNFEHLIAQISQVKPRVAVVDSSLLNNDYFQDIRKLKQSHGDVAIIILGHPISAPNLLRWIVTGTQGYLLKSVTPIQIVQAVRGVSSGQLVISTDSILQPLKGVSVDQSMTSRPEQNIQKLTPRELQVIRLIANGLTDKQVAAKLSISRRTVQSILAGTFMKLGAASRAGAVSIAWQHRWITERHMVEQDDIS